jgi:hypothetical protein
MLIVLLWFGVVGRAKEVDQDDLFIPDHPRIMAGWDDVSVARAELVLGTIGQPNR